VLHLARPVDTASAGLFPSRINCMSVSSLIFFFAMETFWKHHRNFLLAAVMAGLSLKVSTTNSFHSTTSRETVSGSPAVSRGRRAKSEGSGLPSHLAVPADALNPFRFIETHGNSVETSWKHVETFGQLFQFVRLNFQQHFTISQALAP
jgi:hypothetical protein